MRRLVVRVVVDDLQAAPADAQDAWLRLHLLSHRLVAPRTISLDGIFGLLTNVVWTDAGPCAVDGLRDHPAAADRGPRPRHRARRRQVPPDDRLRRCPTGVRIADADRVRLGAHLAEGTTVMHEGFVNYNAGTLGTSMVEGRISAGVVVGDGSDVGGGASIMGTLSGGGKTVISVGERCLLGANAGIGISLGDDCVVEAGCYVTAGTKVTMTQPGTTTASRRSSRPPSCRGRATCCSAATRRPAPSRRSRGAAAASSSTPTCMPTSRIAPPDHGAVAAPVRCWSCWPRSSLVGGLVAVFQRGVGPLPDPEGCQARVEGVVVDL